MHLPRHLILSLLSYTMFSLLLSIHGRGQAKVQTDSSHLQLTELTKQLKQALTQSEMRQADSLIQLGDQSLVSMTQESLLSLDYKTARAEYFRYNSQFPEALTQHREVMRLSAGKEAYALRYAYALFYMALTFERLGIYDSSLLYVEQFLPRFHVLLEADDIRFSDIYNGIGTCYYRANRLSEAESHYLKAKDIAETSLGPYSLQLANCLSNLSAIYREQHDYRKAIESTEQALRISRVIQDEEGISAAYYSLGTYHYFLGDYGRTKEYMEACLEIRKRLFSPQHFSLIGPYQVLGIAHEEAGKDHKALHYLSKGRKIIQANFPPQSLQEGFNYDNTALCYQSLEAYDSALHFVRLADSILPTQLGSDNMALSNHYYTYANILYHLGELDRAMEFLILSNRVYHQRHLTASVSYAQNLSLSGLILSERQQWKQAEKRFDQALSILQLSEPNLDSAMMRELSPEVFHTLHDYTGFLYAQYQATQLPEALARFGSYSDLYLDLSDRFRKQFNDPYTKSILSKDNAKVYDRNIGIYYHLYQQTHQNAYLEAAYRCSEFGRTCLLRDLLDEKIESFAGLPDSVLQKDRQLKKRLTQLNQKVLDHPEDEQNRQALLEARKALDRHISFTLNHYPSYFALTYQTQIPSLADIQSRLKKGENLVEYMQDDTAYYALIVRPERCDWLYVGNKAKINQAISSWKDGIIHQKQDSVRLAGATLYQQLWQPFESLLQGEQVSIVPVGPLFYLSFETLPGASSSTEYLIEKYAISYALSMSVLFTEDQERETDLILAIAPGFEDEIKQEYQEGMDSLEVLDEAYMRTIRQPWSLKLVEQLKETFVLQDYLGQTATESSLKRSLPTGNILYFGTHAIANSDDPMRSKLVLAKEIGPQIEDGYLHAYELFGLPLQADLVILNACETGLGKLQQGEGMISLAYSIQSAGCPSTVMSLWKVDEKMNSRITQDFLVYLDQGLSRRDALRQAKLDVLHSNEAGLKHPFFWGGMVLMGKDGVMTLPRTNTNWMIWLGLGLLLCFILVGMRYSKRLGAWLHRRKKRKMEQ
ncbi:MAG: CHAT domain-containing tetratricopeptide repeat protein [Bacteroidota bacterium]